MSASPDLTRFKPLLHYHRLEHFYAGSAAQWTDCPGNTLRRADGRVFAAATPTGATPRLTLALLSAPYGDAGPFEAGDLIGHAGKDYRDSYERLCAARPDLKHLIYGRVAKQGETTWLQYWLWYFYNARHLTPGMHEGDWEMVQLRMAGDEPDLAVYAQHRVGEKRPWADVGKSGDRPHVYIGLGTHASYFEPGNHSSDLAGDQPTPEVPLELIDPQTHGWMMWKGRWGDTLAQHSWESNSPTSPGRKGQWAKPSDWADEATSPGG